MPDNGRKRAEKSVLLKTAQNCSKESCFQCFSAQTAQKSDFSLLFSVNRQRRTTWVFRSTIGARRSRSRTPQSWLQDCRLACPIAGKMRFDTSLAAICGDRTLLRESRIGPWRYEPFRAPRDTRRACSQCGEVYPGGVQGCTRGVHYQGP